MLEGPTEVPVPIPVKDLSVKRVESNIGQNSTPLPQEILKKMQEERMKMASGVTGGVTESGATEEGVKRAEYKIQLIRFLREKVGLDRKQFSDLPKDLQDAINGFNPQDEKQLDSQFADILEKLNAAGNLNEGQKETVGQFKKAIVDEGILKAETVFEALKSKVEEADISKDEKDEAIKELDELQQDLKKPDIEARKRTLPERIPKVIRIVGLGGVAMLLLSLWRGLKDMMGGRQV